MSEKIKLEKKTRYEQAKQDIAKDVSDTLFRHADDKGETTIEIERRDVEYMVEMTMGRMLLKNLVNEKEARKEVNNG